ncbi:MAG: FMN-binding glutamate synthase family protein [Saprospiraceae bacterium]|nr:FMN-binding glutamate synthase family protein [Saprospiraceae bacterium]|tara:strand:- start:816 stop:2432 length:1617 start_codon:yes stop_codon:yes gene_type:complete
MRNSLLFGSIVVILVLLVGGYIIHQWMWWLILALLPFILAIFYDAFQTEHSLMRNFPLVARSRWIAEWMRPKIHQYFVETDTEGTPISRIFRSIVYQRSKNVLDTSPFGTLLNVYEEGHEWMNHSIAPLDHHDQEADPRIIIGGPDCKQPYSCSIFNISAMSFGSLSQNAIMALNGGAQIGKFAHNTGEGGISPYHLENEGDLIYQIGTGYFGARAMDGGFSAENFKNTISSPSVKMIELKLSQGAKPGHGGILPAKKVTAEIARIRNIEMGQDVISPPYHKAFSTPTSLLEFIKELRDLSGGKPIGFKLCLGEKSEFLAICKAMKKTGIKPDFIAVDGAEGGTGAAPLEFSNSVGTPYKEALAYVFNALVGFDLQQDIKIIAAGKILTGFHMFKAMALGADICYSARGMMLALGCIQALECNKNTCPVGVATQNPKYTKGLVVTDKKHRVANYHKETVMSFVELISAAGISDLKEIDRSKVFRRIEMNKTQRYDEIYPYITKGCLLEEDTIPGDWQAEMTKASPDSFRPRFLEAFEN